MLLSTELCYSSYQATEFMLEKINHFEDQACHRVSDNYDRGRGFCGPKPPRINAHTALKKSINKTMKLFREILSKVVVMRAPRRIMRLLGRWDRVGQIIESEVRWLISQRYNFIEKPVEVMFNVGFFAQKDRARWKCYPALLFKMDGKTRNRCGYLLNWMR